MARINTDFVPKKKTENLLKPKSATGKFFFENTKLSESDCELFLFPGFVDVHVHFREPGFSYKETIKTGSMAAAHGGYTTVFTMPNLNPVPDSRENLEKQLEIIKRDAVIKVLPYGAITKCEKGEALADMEEIASDVIAFSDDGRGVQSKEMMREAMKIAKSLNKKIVAHCEVNELLNGGYIHKGKYAEAHGHAGICSESEWKQVERDLDLAAETGASYHVCHISTKESVELIRQAKANGIDASCETAPHYLVLDDSLIKEQGNWKMNPPIRDITDREALIEGIIDGTIEIVATDHAPHSAEEKSRGLAKSPFGIVGLETAFPVLYTELVKKNIITLKRLIELISENPAKRFGLEQTDGDFCLWNLEEKYTISPADFLSMGKSTPFEGMEVFGKCVATICGGKEVYKL